MEKADETMRERILPVMIILVGVVLVVITGYGYNVYSSNAIQALHDRYNAVVDVHITVPPASPSSLGQGKSTELWVVDPLGIDFGTVEAGQKSATKTVVVTYTMLESTPSPDSMWMFVTTDLSTPGIHLVGNSKKIIKEITYQYPLSVATNTSKTLFFQISVDPNTGEADINFHIVISHDYQGGYASLSVS